MSSFQNMAGDERDAASQLHFNAMQLKVAIDNILHSKDEISFSQSKEWINTFSNKPIAWGASLYLVFPPKEVSPPTSDVQFFSLNILLKKIRSDWVQLTAQDSKEIYEALRNNLPSVSDRFVRSRLCIVVASAAAMAGVDACFQLFDDIKSLEYSIAIELLTALAEEVLHRPRALHWEVTECFQESYPLVMNIIQTRIASHSDQNISPSLLANAFTCFSRWQRAGITLTEVCNDYPILFSSLLSSLGSTHSQLQETAVEVLTALIEEVDLLPGRENAVNAVIAGALTHRDRGLALSSLVSAFGIAEPAVVVRGGESSFHLLQWLVRLTAGGEEQEREMKIAAMAAEAWPRISNIPISKRSSSIQSNELFSLVLKALISSASFSDDPEADMDDNDFIRFRESSAPSAFATCCREMGASYWSTLSVQMRNVSRWQDGEICLFATVSACDEILDASGISLSKKGYGSNLNGEDVKISSISFISNLFSSLPYYSAIVSKDASQLLQIELISTALSMIEKFSVYCSNQPTALESAVLYSIGCLYIPNIKRKAAVSLQALCQIASSTMSNPNTFTTLHSACEKAASLSSMDDDDGVDGNGNTMANAGHDDAHHTITYDKHERSSHSSVRLTIIKALTLVAKSLPPSHASPALTQLYSPPLSRIQLYLSQRESSTVAEKMANDILIISEIISTISESNQNQNQNQILSSQPPQTHQHKPTDPEKVHLILGLVHACWPVLTQVGSVMTQSSVAMAALCSLWGNIAVSVGLEFGSAIPEIITAASSMFTLHKHYSSLDCLSNIVKISKTGTAFSAEIENKLANVPPLLVQALPYLHHLLLSSSKSPSSSSVKTMHSYSSTHFKTSRIESTVGDENEEDKMDRMKNAKIQEEVSDAISSLWNLCRSFIQSPSSSHLLIPSPSFLPLIENAHKYLWPWDSQVSPSAAYFLVDVIAGKSLVQHGDVADSWQIPDHLHHHINQMIPVISTPIIKSCLLASGKGYLENADTLAPIADVLYSLCSCYPSSSKQSLISSLFPSLPSSSSSPSPSPSLFKRGAFSQKDLENFIEAATRQPPHTRLRFHDLICDYSKVAKGLFPAQTFETYF